MIGCIERLRRRCVARATAHSRAVMALRLHDIFFYSVFSSTETISRSVWPKRPKPIHIALLGSAICNAMARADDTCKPRLIERAKMFETWAVQTLELIPSKSLGLSIITQEIVKDGVVPSTAVDIAIGNR